MKVHDHSGEQPLSSHTSTELKLKSDNNFRPSYLPPVAKKRPVGRPPLSSKERLSDALYVRMTPREREVLYREARRRGVTASEPVRELLRAADYGRTGINAKKSKPDAN